MTKQTIEIDVPEGWEIYDCFVQAELDENDAGFAVHIYSVSFRKDGQCHNPEIIENKIEVKNG